MNFRQVMAAKSVDRRKYTVPQIAALKADLAAKMPCNLAAKTHGVHRWVVRDIIDKKSWNGVEPAEVER